MNAEAPAKFPIELRSISESGECYCIQCDNERTNFPKHAIDFQSCQVLFLLRNDQYSF